MAKNLLTEERVWKTFEKICQSKKKDASYTAKPKQSLSVNVMHVELLNGGGQKRKHFDQHFEKESLSTLKSFLKNKFNLIDIFINSARFWT